MPLPKGAVAELRDKCTYLIIHLVISHSKTVTKSTVLNVNKV